MITVYELEQADEVGGIADPKHVWFDTDRIVVYTGSDIPGKTLRDIELTRDDMLSAGVSWNGATWHTDGDFQTQLTAIISAFNNGIIPLTNKVAMRTQDNTVQQLDINQLKALAGTVLQYVQGVYAWSWAEKDKLK